MCKNISKFLTGARICCISYCAPVLIVHSPYYHLKDIALFVKFKSLTRFLSLFVLLTLVNNLTNADGMHFQEAVFQISYLI